LVSPDVGNIVKAPWFVNGRAVKLFHTRLAGPQTEAHNDSRSRAPRALTRLNFVSSPVRGLTYGILMVFFNTLKVPMTRPRPTQNNVVRRLP
jgi:hypothetical protein